MFGSLSDQEVQSHAKIISERMAPWFRRIPNTRYRLIVVNDSFDDAYNFYIEIKRRKTLTRVRPLHEITGCGLDSLLRVLKVLNLEWHLPIEWRHFSLDDERELNRAFH